MLALQNGLSQPIMPKKRQNMPFWPCLTGEKYQKILWAPTLAHFVWSILGYRYKLKVIVELVTNVLIYVHLTMKIVTFSIKLQKQEQKPL